MPILSGAVASLLIAWLRGRSPLSLAQVELRWPVLPILSVALQAATFLWLPSLAVVWAPLIQLVSAGLLGAFLLGNLRFRSLTLVLLGVGLNALVVLGNGGYMPVRAADIERAGFPQVAAELRETGHFQKSTVLDERTRLPWLADVIYLPLPIGPGRMISLGDILIAAGTFLFIQEALVSRREAEGGRARLIVEEDASR